MTAPHADRLIAGYLARLSEAAAGFPREQSTELIQDMKAHIAEARARESGEETDATILNILDRLGEPSVVVADACERLGIRPQAGFRPGIREYAAMFLLPFIWPFGVILLWSSRAWKTRDKIIASLVPPGGAFGLAFIALTAQAAHFIIQGSGAVPAFLPHLGGLPFLIVIFFAPTYLFIQLAHWRGQISSQQRQRVPGPIQ